MVAMPPVDQEPDGHESRVLFGIAALVAIGLLIYWRHRDHS